MLSSQRGRPSLVIRQSRKTFEPPLSTQAIKRHNRKSCRDTPAVFDETRRTQNTTCSLKVLLDLRLLTDCLRPSNRKLNRYKRDQTINNPIRQQSDLNRSDQCGVIDRQTRPHGRRDRDLFHVYTFGRCRLRFNEISQQRI